MKLKKQLFMTKAYESHTLLSVEGIVIVCHLCISFCQPLLFILKLNGF